MSTVMPEQSFPGARAPAKSQRVLACILCQQRKVKCDRKFPCSNCVKAGGVQCVPAAQIPRPRRRRFAERELLDRLRSYESLLRQNNIPFEPLHAPMADKASPSEDGRLHDLPDDVSEEPAADTGRDVKDDMKAMPETVFEVKELWNAIHQRSQDAFLDGDTNDNSRYPHDDVRETIVKGVWNQIYQSNDTLLFGLGTRKTNVHLSTMHPQQVQIFRLWQIYLENVDPLLKVTHAPTLQSRIIEAASDVGNISPSLEALMFSIYCVAIMSLAEDDDECRILFGTPKADLLKDYQIGCQQALLNCDVLRSGDHDSLTALYLYLISVEPQTDPRSLASILGIAIRIAQRLRIHNEASYAKCTILEAEMRRRLWWSLVIFDNRICELSSGNSTMLAPTWDCRPPLNVNDFDLRPEMKIPPKDHEKPTEALFAVLRSELGDFIRHSEFHLDFTNPSLKAIVKGTRRSPALETRDLDALEQTMERKYFQFCNPENSLHHVAIWVTRGSFAKYRLLEHYAKHAKSPLQQTDTQRDHALSLALRMLECDTKLKVSPLIKGHSWFLHLHFPFPAYIHIVQYLRKRPLEKNAERCWHVMSENYDARFTIISPEHGPLIKVFARVVLQAWKAREAACRQLNRPLDTPHFVQDIKVRILQMAASSETQITNTEQPNGPTNPGMDNFSMAYPTPEFGGNSLPSVMGECYSFPEWHEPATMLDIDMNQLQEWTTIDWNPMHAQGW